MRVDFINEIDGVEYSKAKAGKTRGRYGGVEVSFIGKSDLLANKRSTGRTRDKADAEELS